MKTCHSQSSRSTAHLPESKEKNPNTYHLDGETNTETALKFAKSTMIYYDFDKSELIRYYKHH